MMHRGDRGADVKRLQLQLIELGYALPRWGADGDLGDETLGAVSLFVRDHAGGHDDDRATVSDEELVLLARVHRDLLTASGPPADPEHFFDLRGRASLVHDYGRRTWPDTYGITLHQTACVLGERPERMLAVGAHVVVSRAGRVFWLHDFDRLIVHGNGFNTHCVGIEMDGLYAGVEGDLRTVWDDPSTARREAPNEVTEELVAAAQATVTWICSEVARHGGRVRSLVAHRQSSGSRENDPGSALWQAVALPLMTRLGLSDGGPGFKVGTGRPIPEAWDPSRVGIKY